MRSFLSLLALVGLVAAGPIQTRQSSCSYWMEDIQHQGLAAFNSNPSGYTVFRNVKDYGAKGEYPYMTEPGESLLTAVR